MRLQHRSNVMALTLFISFVSAFSVALSSDLNNYEMIKRLPVSPLDNQVQESVHAADNLHFNFTLDKYGIGQDIENAIGRTCALPQAFVKDVRNAAYYAGLGDYNVLVFNLAVPYKSDFEGVILHGIVKYNELTYAIWIFEVGMFVNSGSAGSRNWAFRGKWNRDGNRISFSRIQSQ